MISRLLPGLYLLIPQLQQDPSTPYITSPLNQILNHEAHITYQPSLIYSPDFIPHKIYPHVLSSAPTCSMHIKFRTKRACLHLTVKAPTILKMEPESTPPNLQVLQIYFPMRIIYMNPRTHYFKGTIIYFIKEFKEFEEVIKKKLHEIKKSLRINF